MFVTPQKDCGRPYEALGWVYFAPAALRSGMHGVGDGILEFETSGGYVADFLALAAANGADAIVDVRMAPVLNAFGSPISYSLSGLAVRFTDVPPPPPVTYPDAPPAAPPLAPTPGTPPPLAPLPPPG